MLNTMLQHVGMLWIIETHERLKYDMDKHNSDWVTSGSWYNTSIFKELHGNVLEEFIINARTNRYNIMCSIYAHRKIINQNTIMEAAVVVIHYHQIQQQNYYIRPMQP